MKGRRNEKAFASAQITSLVQGKLAQSAATKLSGKIPLSSHGQQPHENNGHQSGVKSAQIGNLVKENLPHSAIAKMSAHLPHSSNGEPHHEKTHLGRRPQAVFCKSCGDKVKMYILYPG